MSLKVNDIVTENWRMNRENAGRSFIFYIWIKLSATFELILSVFVQGKHCSTLH